MTTLIEFESELEYFKSELEVKIINRVKELSVIHKSDEKHYYKCWYYKQNFVFDDVLFIASNPYELLLKITNYSIHNLDGYIYNFHTIMEYLEETYDIQNTNEETLIQSAIDYWVDDWVPPDPYKENNDCLYFYKYKTVV